MHFSECEKNPAYAEKYGPGSLSQGILVIFPSFPRESKFTALLLVQITYNEAMDEVEEGVSVAASRRVRLIRSTSKTKKEIFGPRDYADWRLYLPNCSKQIEILQAVQDASIR